MHSLHRTSRRFVATLAFAAALALTTIAARTAAPPAATPPPDPLHAALIELRASARARDSLTAIADSTTGASREFIEELIWKRHLDTESAWMNVADRLRDVASAHGDTAAARRLVQSVLRDQWKAYMTQLERRRGELTELGRESDAATGVQRLTIESDMTRLSDRILESYQGFVSLVLALEHVGIDASEQRTYLTRGLRDAATGLVARLEVVTRDRANAAAQLARNTSNADLRYALDASEERVNRASLAMNAVIALMDRLGLADTDLRVALILSTGRITADVFRWGVLLGLLQAWGSHLGEILSVKAPQWVFQALLIVITFFAFRWASRLVGRVVRRAVRRSQLSELMRATVSRLAVTGVMVLGVGVILTQLGVQLAPLLAGFGIAGLAVGFALQNTIANLAAGSMILGTRPFDLGDDIEAAGVAGTVKRMSLISTTILTPDNQTLIVPNSSIWSGVIRNRTSQPIRRVDLTFSAAYGDAVDQVERVLTAVVRADEKVLSEPAPIIKLHQLGESSVNYIVRVWTKRERYWDVYWDLTRAVKLHFDQEGLTIPFPQQEVTHRAPSGATVTVETKPGPS
jgi:small conductance mechanosensitive channel